MTTRQKAAEQAAQERAAGVAQRADRPRQRRAVEERSPAGGLVPVSVPLSRCEIRGALDGDTPLVFEGFASVTGRAYEMWDWYGPYVEYVHVGAFAETLATEGLDVPLVLDHVSSKRIARTQNAASPLVLSEVTLAETTGLKVLAPSLPREDQDVRYIVPKLETGLIDEMSFRFRITSGRWSEDYTEYHIHAVDIHRGDVAIVGYGANPHTAGSGLRGDERPATARSKENDLARVRLSLALAGN
jgi:HK97 family phage prohead protease